jgi:hypothetical protein
MKKIKNFSEKRINSKYESLKQKKIIEDSVLQSLYENRIRGKIWIK